MAGPRDTPLDQNKGAPWQSPTTTQDTVVLNVFDGVRFEERTRTTSKGTSVRYSLEIEAEPILHNLRGLDLGRGPAQAILDLIRRQHYAITQPAAPSTLERRDRAASELANGTSRLIRGKLTTGDRVRRRYVAARTENNAPGTSRRFGSDSNLLYNGWFLRQNPAEGSYTVNVPANRFDPTTFNGGLAALQAFIGRLVELIPALRGVGILDDKSFIEAVGKSNPVRVLRNAGAWNWSAAKAVGQGTLKILRAAGLAA